MLFGVAGAADMNIAVMTANKTDQIAGMSECVLPMPVGGNIVVQCENVLDSLRAGAFKSG